jgi:hypothetical protein
MTLYTPLKSKKIQLGPRAVLDYDFGDGKTVVPIQNCKVFVHWLTENGKMRATYTMTFSTKLQGDVRLTNGLDTDCELLVVENA